MLLLQVFVLLVDLAVETLNVIGDLLHFVLANGELSSRLECHILDLVDILVVLLLNLIDLIFSVVGDLCNGEFVTLDHLLVVLLLLINLGLLVLHLLPVLLFLISNVVLMLSLQLLDSLLIQLLLLLFLGLQSLESTSSNEHLLRILVPLLLNGVLLVLNELLPLNFLGVLGLLDLSAKGLLFVECIGLLPFQFILPLTDGVCLFLDIDLNIYLIVSLFTLLVLALQVFFVRLQSL